MLPGPDVAYLAITAVGVLVGLVVGVVLGILKGVRLGHLQEYRRWVAARAELYRWPGRRTR